MTRRASLTGMPTLSEQRQTPEKCVSSHSFALVMSFLGAVGLGALSCAAQLFETL
jgi:hypothetical protein